MEDPLDIAPCPRCAQLATQLLVCRYTGKVVSLSETSKRQHFAETTCNSGRTACRPDGGERSPAATESLERGVKLPADLGGDVYLELTDRRRTSTIEDRLLR